MNQPHFPTQIVLPLGFQEEKTFETYFAGENEAILSILHNAAIGRGEYYIYLWGKSKVGLTHLLHACCYAAKQKGLNAIYGSLNQLTLQNGSLFENLDTTQLVCLDDFDRLAGQLSWEEKFFDFFNRMMDSKKRLILAAKRPPEKLGFHFADIVSRLKSGILFSVQDLNDTEKANALISKARDRGIILTEEIALFILHRFPRDLGTLFQILDRLDHVSLEQKRKLTLPFVRQIMNSP